MPQYHSPWDSGIRVEAVKGDIGGLYLHSVLAELLGQLLRTSQDMVLMLGQLLPQTLHTDLLTF